MSTLVESPGATAPATQGFWSRLIHGNRRGEPFLRQPQRAIWYAILVVAIVIGAVAFVQRMLHGMAVTDLSSQVPWGIWVAFYIYFVGVSSGAFLLSTLPYVFRLRQFDRVGRIALWAALVSIGLALGFIGTDLGRIERSTFVIAHFHWTSPLSWEVRFFMFYIAMLIASLWIAVRMQLGKTPEAKARHWLRILGIVGIPLTILGVPGASGTLFAVVKARGMWAGGLFPVIFIVSGMVAGTALVTLIYILQRRGIGLHPNDSTVRPLGWLLLALVSIDLLLTFYEFFVPLISFQDAETTIIDIMMTGPFWWSFWFVQIGCGLLIPFAILVSPLRKRAGWLAVATISLLIGIVGVRFNIVVPPLIAPVIKGYPTNNYLPTLVEWGVSMFFIAGGAFVYSLLSEVLPIHEPAATDMKEA
ncbi:MAG: polysulfide reductase NrfD [Ancrocorticia sp.]|jgi:molybdopterin-containing oxidoreductase family membrane subunit|nr:polysulfide reductase NrfD [Ancrocorticia sp.]MCI1932246.1 polysulfide reductase NrfD [Ancrocorticia sp.]MCI2028880.1 polysulfide reductase NrfD [Ancrocorticia sp.]MCI2179049.1 polysulfide reductase NrfD [Ancrocorticia sp.]MCI2192724.1 polysulfide reductase NrfD [Ancrocorticia sp.]